MESLTQDQINELIKQAQAGDALAQKEEINLNDIEKDALGEAINISMGAASTALSAMLKQRVLITTPQVSITKTKDFNLKPMEPAVLVCISYIKGLSGQNVLLMKQSDVKIMVDLLMGGGGIAAEGELTEMHQSAISEVMNQMMGSSSTAMANFFNRPINISTPTVHLLSKEQDCCELIKNEVSEKIISIQFNLTIGDTIKSRIMNIMSLPFGKELANIMLGSTGVDTGTKESKAPRAANNAAPKGAALGASVTNGAAKQAMQEPTVNVKAVKYHSFDEEDDVSGPVLPENLNLIMDVPLLVTVQIGKTQKPVKEILEFTQGSIIELDKQAGDPAEIIVNGQLIAKGDIVVIDDNFGIRITEIIPPSKRRLIAEKARD